MALTYSQYVGDGSTRLFAVTFPYISKSHVKVRVDGNEVPFTWSTPALVQLDMVPSAGAVIDIRRETPNTEPLVDFHDGSTLVESDLDLSTIQSLYIAQELVDSLSAKLGADADGTIDAGSRRIKNVRTPRDADDAATKAYVDGATGNAPAYASQAQEAASSAQQSAGVAGARAAEATEAALSASASALQAFENSKKAVTPFIWTAAEGQTEFPFGQTIEPAMVLVFVSGAKYPLGMGDYAITPTKITLSSPAAAGDIVEAYVFAPFTVANALIPANNLADLPDKAAARQNLGLGSAAIESAGVGANQLLKLDASGKLPPVDGSQLLGLLTKDLTVKGLLGFSATTNRASSAGTSLIMAALQGAGGGGAGPSGSTVSRGGGAGAFGFAVIPVLPGAVYQVTVGAGGPGGGPDQNGSQGGDTVLTINGETYRAGGGGGSGNPIGGGLSGLFFIGDEGMSGNGQSGGVSTKWLGNGRYGSAGNGTSGTGGRGGNGSAGYAAILELGT